VGLDATIARGTHNIDRLTEERKMMTATSLQADPSFKVVASFDSYSQADAFVDRRAVAEADAANDILRRMAANQVRDRELAGDRSSVRS
jgi:hypothetical protein